MRTALVLGGAACLWDDIHAFWGLHGFDPAPGNLVAPEKPWQGVVACNDAGAEWPGALDAWVTLHPRFWDRKGWKAKRAANGFPPARAYYAHEAARPPVPDDVTVTDYLFPGQDKSGSSGLFAAKVALIDLGFDRAVLCGIPLTRTPHFFGGEPWRSAENYRRQWLTVPEEYRARMRSMSGWTAVLLGRPETAKETDTCPS